MKVAKTLNRLCATFLFCSCLTAFAEKSEGYDPFTLNNLIDQNPAKAIALLHDYGKTHAMRPIDHFRLARAFHAKGDHRAALASWQAAQKMDGSGRFLSEPKRLGELGTEIQSRLNPVRELQVDRLPDASKTVASSSLVPKVETASASAPTAEIAVAPALSSSPSPLQSTGVRPLGQDHTQAGPAPIRPLEAAPNAEPKETIRNLGTEPRSAKHTLSALDELVFALQQSPNGGAKLREHLLALIAACIAAIGLALLGLKIRARSIEATLHLPRPDEVLRACLAGARQKSVFTVH